MNIKSAVLTKQSSEEAAELQPNTFPLYNIQGPRKSFTKYKNALDDKDQNYHFYDILKNNMHLSNLKLEYVI